MDPAIEALHDLPRDEAAVLLHSGRWHERWALRSLLAVPTRWYVCDSDGTARIIDRHGELDPLSAKVSGDPWADLDFLLHRSGLGGRWFGYLSYDLRRATEGEKLQQPAADDRGWPLIALGWVASGGWEEYAPPHTPTSHHPAEVSQSMAAEIVSNFSSRAAYERAVARVIRYIGAGDVFQVNLAQRLTTSCAAQPRELFARLAGVSPAWYGACVDVPLPTGAWGALLSTSPELFLELDDHRVITRPIKGTHALHHRAAAILRDSEKDRAELNMIVDLLRNDLGRVCRFGSIEVTDPRRIEAHPTVYHGVATIEGELRAEANVVDLLRATMPGGSITGAPKVRAMQIIDELEPNARGPYCGAIGWIESGACCLNLAIRTMSLQPDGDGWRVDFSVGGGIVADSIPAAEYEETLTKAQAMLQALRSDSARPVDERAS